jgi:pyruvate/2-oxoglutarate dehydrogenase complex dihydrolipoamide dehydrogenase (E3) component
MRVALVERELVAGECAYWACIPSKTLVRPTGVRAEAGRAAGVGKPSLSFAKVTADRDEMIRHLDDTAEVEGYRARGIAVHRGTATALGPGRIQVGGEVVQAGRIVVATGSESSVPPMRAWPAALLPAGPGRPLLGGGGRRADTRVLPAGDR